VEADGDTSRVGIGTIIRDLWESSRVREAHPDWSTGSVEMWRLGELGCFW
jgi:hypothetical protein